MLTWYAYTSNAFLKMICRLKGYAGAIEEFQYTLIEQSPFCIPQVYKDKIYEHCSQSLLDIGNDHTYIPFLLKCHLTLLVAYLFFLHPLLQDPLQSNLQKYC